MDLDHFRENIRASLGFTKHTESLVEEFVDALKAQQGYAVSALDSDRRRTDMSEAVVIIVQLPGEAPSQLCIRAGCALTNTLVYDGELVRAYKYPSMEPLCPEHLIEMEGVA